MGDRPKRNEKLAATVTRRPPDIDWASVFGRQQANMNMNSMLGSCPVESEKQAMFYNWTPSLNVTPVVANQATSPEKFVYYPPQLPKAWDQSMIRLHTPMVPGIPEDVVGGPFF
jgi:hypothetical protein